VLTMPVNGGFHWKVIPDEYLNVVPLVDFNQRTWLLIVDEIDIAGEAI
jgi:hypothetical protein